ncbi:ABC transporter permease [Lolliginicoccus levis]|uniref:ABC transporter permease n=1 Tax=Lolliginicoccus levis TaxID=2919542 RepID=UPI00241EE1B1|nr:ABC transporter permease [Lolliginicoccus levis]
MTTTHAPTRSGHPLAGTWTLTRLALRRDRIRLPLWIAGLTLFTLSSVSSFEQTYPTAADRDTVARLAELPAMIGMVGRNYQPADYHFGIMIGHQMTVMTALVFGLMSILQLVRHTRAEEEAGRAELVRSSVVGRHATLTAALIIVTGTSLIAGLLTAAGLAATGLQGITPTGSLLYGLSIAAAGIVFAGITAITVQITEFGRGATGLALATLGIAYVLRAFGDIGDNSSSWLSPLYWGQASRPYATDERWWPLLLALAVAATLIALGYRLSTQRDVGAGLRAARRGAAAASPLLGTPFGLANRLHRASLIAWTIGMLLFGASYGMLIDGIEDMIEQIAALGDIISQIPGSTLVDSYVAMLITFLSIVISAQAVLAVNRMRSEETAGRAEPILSTGVSRQHWMASHLTIALGSSALLAIITGIGMGGSGALVTGDIGFLTKVLGAALAHIPAIWVAVGVAAALYGLAPRLLALGWIVPVYGIIVVYLGGILGFPEWTHRYSPFGYIPDLPAADLQWMPLIALTAIAVALAAAGIVGFRRRDLESK